MKILLSAFACAPNVGSEAGAAWRWAMELARHHQVVVITDEFRREAIEAELAQRPMDNPSFVFFRPRWLRQVPFRSFWSRLLYVGWQYSLLPFAWQLHRAQQFDFVHHLTWGVFRHPSFLGLLGIPFVLGPLGGGEDAPLRLKRTIHGRAKLGELFRTALNWMAHYNPVLWWAFSRAIVIFARTPSTARMLPYGLGKRAVLAQEIGASPRTGIVPRRREAQQPLRVIFAGRLLALKGVHFALGAVAYARERGADVHFSVIGSGPYLGELHQRANKLGLFVEFVDHLPQCELFERFRHADCFLFPSLHDSGGTVVLEALSFGLPVVCLDLCGPAEFVDDDCGTVVPTAGKSESEVEAALGDALVMMATNLEALARRSEGALRRAAYHAIENQVGRAMVVIKDAIECGQPGVPSGIDTAAPKRNDMGSALNHATAAGRLIRQIAGVAQQRLMSNPRALRISRKTRIRPIDYMRWAEFDAVLSMLDLKPGQTVLDVASPQWLTLYLAASNPDVSFNFISIMESEVEPYRAIAAAYGLGNLEYAIKDVRKLPWPSSSFDKVLSVSVLEHVYPEVGGDIAALNEIRRVLKDDGELLLTLPCKHTRGTVYMDGPVYEREAGVKNFFAREYDMESFHDLAMQTGFRVDAEWRIEERPGLLAIDCLEWGEGRAKWFRPWLVKRRAKFERLTGISIDETLAKHYLRVGKRPDARLVNVAARLKLAMTPSS